CFIARLARAHLARFCMAAGNLGRFLPYLRRFNRLARTRSPSCMVWPGGGGHASRLGGWLFARPDWVHSEPGMNIDICVCTYRRAQVVETLRSLGRLDREPDWAIRVIVVDNDETPSAFELAEATAREMALTLTYVHAPARNISIARNAGLNAAK